MTAENHDPSIDELSERRLGVANVDQSRRTVRGDAVPPLIGRNKKEAS